MSLYNQNRVLRNNRVLIGKKKANLINLPELIEIQLKSFEWFLQRQNLVENGQLVNHGLHQLFQEIFPIKSHDEKMTLEYDKYILCEDDIKFDEYTAKVKGQSYSIPLKVLINLRVEDTGEIRQKDIYLGDIPLMTDRGTFIINGAERVVVSQIHRSPGVIFNFDEKVGMFSSRIIPYKGSWLEFEVDEKKKLVYVKIDRKKKLLVTFFLRALGFDTREKIIELFYKEKTIKLSTKEEQESATREILTRDIYKNISDSDRSDKIIQAGTKLSPLEIDKLVQENIKEVKVIDFANPQSLHNQIIINCFEKEDFAVTKDEQFKDEPSKYDSIEKIHSILKPGEPITLDAAEKDINSLFFSEKKYDLGAVGRYKINKKFNFSMEIDDSVLRKDDIISIIKYLIMVYDGEGTVDDIDHLGNRRIRSVGELLINQLKVALIRVERIAKERMQLKDIENAKPQDLISVKPISTALMEFFSTSQLSQFMDQVNPLAELTHKRRMNALGPGGLSRDRAGFEVRDVHYTHYGRMCPIETPEGSNIGLIVSLCNFTRVNDYGFLETPYKKVINGKVSEEMHYLSAMDEERHFIAQASALVDDDGNFLEKQISCRKSGDYTVKNPEEIDYIDVSPKQIISVATSLIPFLEHDDANRALMGSNMQRQAVPLLITDAPYVGTGMEEIAAYDSGVCTIAKKSGKVSYVTSKEVRILDADGNEKKYPMLKNKRTNQDTCFNQKPTVNFGDEILKGQAIADGPATDKGELALGKNVLVAYMPWNGYNYEDAIVLSERLVKDDVFTSVHIKEYICDVRETKLGPERITRDIPNVSEFKLRNLDEDGIIRIGASVKPDDILVGKVTPKSDVETTPEYRLLNSIFGEKAKDVKESSLKAPHGAQGIVIDVQRLRRDSGEELSPGVEEIVKVYVANKRKIKVGDKMAGRHGNKGVVSIVLPIEDMPYMADGTPIDICLNPLGVPSRMNIGQIMEAQLGLAGKALGVKFATSVFESASVSQIQDKLEEAGLPRSAKMVLYDGRTGTPFVNPVGIGITYMLKLSHLVDDKMHARSTGPYSLVTQQPLGGKAQFGGQRLGEMEVWALESYGAAHTLQEFLTVKSDDMNGRTKMYENIVKSDYTSSPGIPESFNVLVQELRGLAVNVTVWDARGKQIPLSEKEEELLTRVDNFQN
ncbi:MAG: DNA-directed RNA polymerase subunit beta [Spirochaetes bacterium GWF1_31_7]|nr:MAG: DNA-directed RNA polymerase subunit beta [Spirochaetes bacterium GWE1_32_154]OHD47327.1 MAG: DNA-directed RNA polymerase subunit beta [Spirochaetes bacterium GWE2_31_10]OHD53194.1 MAG: DNA-directed RNA polymerase subunit beta [Spirochaetes bacterium GWF1_31_7]HBI37348.1 DNA-directed RNA polymerase subunit beta [Spirochaetia bacterium]